MGQRRNPNSLLPGHAFSPNVAKVMDHPDERPGRQMAGPSACGEEWTQVTVNHLEDLRDAVYGAGFEANQFSRGRVKGSLTFAVSDRVTYSSGYLDGQIELLGPLSETAVTLGVGINLPAGSRQWLDEVETGEIGIFLPGDEHEAYYTPGALYVCAALSAEHLEEIAAGMGLVLDAKQLGGTGISSRSVPKGALAALQKIFVNLHVATPAYSSGRSLPGRRVLETLIGILGREPRCVPRVQPPTGYEKMVSRAREYIHYNLETPLSISVIARAAFASPSTLYRAFHEVLGETPQSYVRKIRLNRIRRDLATNDEARCTITMIANRWGISELGRFSGWYRELFGELPSQTMARKALINRTNIP